MKEALIISIKSHLAVLDKKIIDKESNSNKELISSKKAISDGLKKWLVKNYSSELEAYLTQIESFSSFRYIYPPFAMLITLNVSVFLMLLITGNILIQLILLVCILITSVLTYFSFLKNKKIEQKRMLLLRNSMYYSLQILENS